MNAFRAVSIALAGGLDLFAYGAHAGAVPYEATSPHSDPSRPAEAPLTAEQVVDRSVEARGGLAAWRRIESTIWMGRLESTHSPIPSLPFKLEQKRPNKSRFEINEPSQRSMRVFDGMSGWKMRMGEDGRPDVKRFTSQEVKFAREAPGLEGPLIDFRSRGGTVALEGTEEFDGHKVYRIVFKPVTGELQKIWIDAETFLETRYDRPVYGQNGATGMVSVRYRDYKQVEGLAVPSVLEIGGEGGGKPDRMIIDGVALNPKIDDREFSGLGEERGHAAPPGAAVAPR